MRPEPAVARGPSLETLLELVSGRRGHFRLESGLHGGLWLDLDPLFADAKRIEPFVRALAVRIAAHDASMVCGPLVGGAFLAQLVARELGVEFAFTERQGESEGGGLFRARYRLAGAYASRVEGRRVAMVDDVMSAGSSLRATYAELREHGAMPVVAGALLLLGTRGSEFFAKAGVAVEAVTRDAYEMWTPDECPFCTAKVPLEEVTTPSA